MAVLKDLIVHGASRFINGAEFNTVKANTIDATNGYFKYLKAIKGDIENLTVEELLAQKATVVGLLDVKGEMHTNSWTNANIANIGGSFYISPTLSSAASNITISFDSTISKYTVQVSGGSFVTSSSGITWSTGSKVMITGSVTKNNVTYPLGTCTGNLKAISETGFTVNQIAQTGIVSDIPGDSTTNGSLAILVDTFGSGVTFTSNEIKISMYEIGPSTAYKPVGILLTSYGINKETYIDIYGGVNVKNTGLTDNIPDGFTIPNVRIGYLGGLPSYDNSWGASRTPTGWGIYTDNGYFKGVIVADSGLVGKFTIADDLHSGDGIGMNDNVYVSPGTEAPAGISIAGSPEQLTWAFTAGANFGVTTNGTLYAKNAQISGSVAATNGFTVTSATTNGITLASMTTSGITLGDTTAANNKFNILITDSAVSGKGPGILLRQGTNILNEITTSGMNIYLASDTTNSIAEFGDSIRVGATTTGHAVLDDDGMDVFIGDTSVAHYGDYARVGKEGEANTTISSNQVTISASDNINALRITPDGNTQTIHHSIMRHHLIENGKVYTFTQPSAIPSGTTAQYKLRHKSNSLASFEIKKGTSKSTTSVTTPFPFQYSATTTQVTIKNTGSAPFYLESINYSTTEVSPLTEIGGVLTIGQDSHVGPNTVFAVGNGTDTNLFEISSLVSIGGSPISDFVVEEGTDGIWTYRKWNSGIAECWGKVTVASRTYAANGGYYNVTGAPPTGLFVSGSNPVLSATGGITSNIQTNIGFTFASDVNIQTYLINRSASTITNPAWVCWHLTGRWK